MALLNVQSLIDKAARRCGHLPEQLTSEQTMAIKENLSLLLAHNTNKGLQLWKVIKFRMGLQNGNSTYILPEDFERPLNLNYSLPTLFTATSPFGSNTAAMSMTADQGGGVSTSTNPSALTDGQINIAYVAAPNASMQTFAGLSIAEGDPTVIGFSLFINSLNLYVAPGVGGLVTNSNTMPNQATQSYHFVVESSVDNAVWELEYDFGVKTYTDSWWNWASLTFPGHSHLSSEQTYWRVRETTGKIFAIREFRLGYNTSDIPMAPLNRDDYWNLPNKEFQSDRPLQYWFDRQKRPELRLWPVPNDDTISINMLYHARVNDTMTLKYDEDIDIPERWAAYIQARLAADAGFELPNIPLDRVNVLTNVADKLEKEVSDEETDDAPIYWGPNISYYTR